MLDEATFISQPGQKWRGSLFDALSMLVHECSMLPRLGLGDRRGARNWSCWQP